MLGALTFDEGKFYYGQDFTIQRANINFDTISYNDPIIDVTAVSNIERYLVSLQLQNRMSDPSVLLFVEPSTDETGLKITQDQIIFLIKNFRKKLRISRKKRKFFSHQN